jgi:O-antigen/teichoic acid export membrane protein
VLALRGGAELVALWAQLGSVIELVAGVAFAGVGTGLAVYVARTRRPERQRDLLREAIRIGLRVSLPVAIAVALAGALFQDFMSGERLPAALIAVGAAAGWIAVVPGLVNALWLGQERRGLMLALATGSALVVLAVSLVAPQSSLLFWLAVAHAIPALLFLFIFERQDTKPRFRTRSHPLRRYVLPGLSIGILSPASMLVARAVVGESLSWHEAGVLQALWRVADWVCILAAGVLSVLFLPRFAAARGTPRFAQELRHAALVTVLPAAAIFVVLFLAQRPLFAALYAPDFAAGDAAVAILFAGSVVRIASWIPLFALYAVRRTLAIAVGELLSLPLFAALTLVFRNVLSLEAVGVCWLAAYAAYCAFNFWALRRP